MEWTGLDWSGVEWTGLDWTGLDWTGLDWAGLDWTDHPPMGVVRVCPKAPDMLAQSGVH